MSQPPSNDSWERVLSHVGSLDQIAGTELVEAIDGEERGVRKALVRTGGGLRFNVLIDRGFDIGPAEFKGFNTTWRSPVGAVHPHSFQEDGWLRRFAGGLLVTCGPDNVGLRSGDKPLHGRHSGTRSRLLGNRVIKRNGAYVIEIEGEIPHYSIFGDHLVVRRMITAPCGGTSLRIEDDIENAGSEPAPLMWLYHCNFGYPLLDSEAELLIQSEIEPRDGAAAEGLGSAREVQPPKPRFEEQVFFHNLDGETAEASLVNKTLPLAVTLRYRKSELPQLIQWKLLRKGDYVMALEPATCRVSGFEKEKDAGRVIELAPGEHRKFALEFEFSDSEEKIVDLRQRRI